MIIQSPAADCNFDAGAVPTFKEIHRRVKLSVLLYWLAGSYKACIITGAVGRLFYLYRTGYQSGMSANILLIESARVSAPSFAPSLKKKGYLVSIRNKVKDVLKEDQPDNYDLVILDAASMQTSGFRMCKKLASSMNGVPIIHITPEGTGSAPKCSKSLILEQPFTARKLLNRVVRFIPKDDEAKPVQTGPISLHVERQIVRCHGRETRLTPKQTELLKLFLDNPGRVMTREKIIKLIWNTEYVGDTRTLDVHMSWLRKAVEADPSNPRLFITIRGIGYRLDVEA